MCTPKDVLDPSVDGQISYLCGRHDCSLLHFGDPVIGTVYDDRILVSSGQWWPLPRGAALGCMNDLVVDHWTSDVVDHWTSDDESSSHRDVLLLHDIWTTSNRLSGHKIIS